jgi:hypothetical protein
MRPAGWRLLVPGGPQWSWGERERATAFAGSYLAALVVGLLAWGSAPGWLLLAFAFAAHVASAADAIRRGAFPGFGRWVPLIAAASGLGVLGYVPAFGLGLALAWPAGRTAAPGEGYLIDRSAYRLADPAAGEWVWFRDPAAGGWDLGRVRAGPGEELEWSDGRSRIGGQLLVPPARLEPAIRELVCRVPEHCLLVEPVSAPDRPSRLVLVEGDRILGRVWARFRPVGARGLLD